MRKSLSQCLLLLLASIDLACCTGCPSCEYSRICLHLKIAVLVPMPDKDYDPAFDQGLSIIPAVQLAAEQINNTTDLLSSFCLELTPVIRDAGCDKPPKTALAIADILKKEGPSRNIFTGIIGPACSEDSLFFANTFNSLRNFSVSFFSLPVFYTGTTPYLSENAEAFPNAYGMISSADILIDTLMMIAVEEDWNWGNIAVLYDDTRQHFTQIYTAFTKRFNDSQDIGYIRQIADSQVPLREIIDRNIRIVVVFADKKPARQLACLAGHGQPEFNFVFPIRQFIFIERSLEDFLGDENTEPSFVQRSEGRRYYCDRDRVMRGLNGSVLLNQALDSVDPDAVTVSNYTVGKVKQLYKERLHNQNLPASSLAYAYYDAIWAFAFGFHAGANSNSTTPAERFDVVHDTIKGLSFQGVSSWIDFKDRQHVSNDVIISQVTGSALTDTVLRNKNKPTYSTETFISDKFKTETSVLHDSLAALGFLLIIVLFVATLIIQVLMMVYRDYPSVKASSSRLNHFIYLGCYLLTVAIAANTLRQTVPATNGDVLCNMGFISSILACTLISGTILIKSWRTYRIFHHVFKLKSHYSLHDATLSIFIVTLTLLQGALFIPMLVVSPFQEATSFTYDTSQWPPIRRVQPTCAIQSVGYLIIPIIFLLCIVLATVVLATLNRKIKRKHFRWTKEIIILVYTLTILWGIGIPLLVLFHRLQLPQDFIYFFDTFLLTATIVLCQTLLIIPFLIPVARGQNISRLSSDNYALDYGITHRQSVLSFDRQLSILRSFRRSFRRSYLESQPDHRSSIQSKAKHRSSLPPILTNHKSNPPVCNDSTSTNHQSIRSPPVRYNSTSTARSLLPSCSSTDSPTSTSSHGGLFMILQPPLDTDDQKGHTTLHSISKD